MSARIYIGLIISQRFSIVRFYRNIYLLGICIQLKTNALRCIVVDAMKFAIETLVYVNAAMDTQEMSEGSAKVGRYLHERIRCCRFL